MTDKKKEKPNPVEVEEGQEVEEFSDDEIQAGMEQLYVEKHNELIEAIRIDSVRDLSCMETFVKLSAMGHYEKIFITQRLKRLDEFVGFLLYYIKAMNSETSTLDKLKLIDSVSESLEQFEEEERLLTAAYGAGEAPPQMGQFYDQPGPNMEDTEE